MHTFKSISLITILLFSSAVYAGDLDKSFKYLNTGDYANAYKFLQEAIHDEPDNAAANFGLAKFYSLKDNKQYNIDSANIFIKVAAKKIPLDPKDKQTKKFLTLGVRDYTIQTLQNDINKSAYAKYEDISTVEAYQTFLDNYTDKDLLDDATKMRNQLAFTQAKEANTAVALDSFIKKYPSAEQQPEANKLYQKLLYDETTVDHTYQSYKKYLDSYPTGAYIVDAQKKYETKLLEYYNNRHDLQGYLEFDKNYPTHPARNTVQDSIYTITTIVGTQESYKNFITTYKTNHNVNRAWNALYAMYTADASEGIYQKFLDNYPDFPDKERVYKDIQLSKLDLKPLQQGTKWGYAVQPTPDSMMVIIPAEYEEAFPFKNGLAAVRSKACSGKCSYYYIDKNNQRAFDGDYNFAGNFDNGHAIVGIGNCDEDSCLFGLIDRRGKWTVQPGYDELNDPSEGLYLVGKNSKYGFINATGEVVISLKFSDALPFSEGMAGVALDTNWFFIDKTGTQIFMEQFQNVSSYKDSLCAVSPDGDSWGYIDRSGKFVIEPVYEAADDFEGGFGVVSKKEKDPKHKGLFVSQRYKIDRNGKVIEKMTAPKTDKKKPTGKKKGRR